jgi:hypothetical protein
LRTLAVSLLALWVLLSPTRAWAYPWMIEHGYSTCAACHVDPSGGELLRAYGRVQSYALLAAEYGHPRQDAPEDPAWGFLHTPQSIPVSASYRHLVLVPLGSRATPKTFPMQADVYAGIDGSVLVASASLGVAKVPAGSPHARAAQLTRDQGSGWNLISRTHWVGARLSPEVTVRAGRLNLPFGLRIPEHTLWVREATRTDRESDQQHGLASSYSGETWRGELMVVFGNYQVSPDRFRERGYSMFAEVFASEAVFFGMSSLVTHAFADSLTFESVATTRQAHGLFSRVAFSRHVTAMAEADVLAKTRSAVGYVGLVQLGVEPLQGLHFGASFEALDAGQGRDQPAVPGFGTPKAGVWATVDYFFLPGLEFRFDALRRTNEPFTLLGQLHVVL